MITSAKNSSWASDFLIKDLKHTGLTAPSIIRQKIFTIDKRLIVKNIGKLSANDQKVILRQLKKHLDI